MQTDRCRKWVEEKECVYPTHHFFSALIHSPNLCDNPSCNTNAYTSWIWIEIMRTVMSSHFHEKCVHIKNILSIKKVNSTYILILWDDLFYRMIKQKFLRSNEIINFSQILSRCFSLFSPSRLLSDQKESNGIIYGKASSSPFSYLCNYIFILCSEEQHRCILKVARAKHKKVDNVAITMIMMICMHNK